MSLQSSSSCSSLRSHSEYLTAFELETWKAEQTQLFREHLQAEESKHRTLWSQQSQQSETERVAVFTSKVKTLQALENRLRQKISDLEQRELKIVKTESEISSKVVNFQAQIRRLQEEHSLALKAQAAGYASEICAISDRLRLAESRASENDRKLVEFAAFDSLKTETKMKDVEISSLKEKISVLSKSRDHFRRALLDVFSKKDEISDRVRRLQEERNALLVGGICDASDPLIRALDEEISGVIDQ